MAHDDPKDAARYDQPATDKPKSEGTLKSSRTPVILAVGLLAVAAGAVGLYGMLQPTGKAVVASHTGACAKSLDSAQAIDPLLRGEMASLAAASEPNTLAAIAFDDADGRKVTIDSFKGKTVLLNLWATWCVPCRKEMPSLDRLQTQLGSKNFTVVPINIDQARLEKAKTFLKDIGTNALPFYSDKSGEIVQTLRRTQKFVGLPTSVLIGADGCEIATMAGPAEWDSPEAKTVIERVQKTAAAAGGRA